MSTCHILLDTQYQKCGWNVEKSRIFGTFPRPIEIFIEMKAVGEVNFFCFNQNSCFKENKKEKRKKWKVWEVKWWLIHSCKLEPSSLSCGKHAVIMFPYLMLLQHNGPHRLECPLSHMLCFSLFYSYCLL